MQMINNEDLKKILDACMVISLEYLCEVRFVDRCLLKGKWVLNFNLSDRLREEKKVAGTTIHSNGLIVVACNHYRSLNELIYAQPHEAVHVAQIARGNLIPSNGFSCWKGRKYPNLSVDDPDYFVSQPWEAEAQRMEGNVRSYLQKLMPSKTRIIGTSIIIK